MVIIETKVFTRRVTSLLTDDVYRDLQSFLVEHPDVGDAVQGTPGLRKVRWSAKGHGKRGGVRVIYFWAVNAEQLLMLFIFAKNERDDLSVDQAKILSRIVREEYR